MTWDVISIYIWVLLMFFVYNEVYPFCVQRMILRFFAVLGVVAGVSVALL